MTNGNRTGLAALALILAAGSSARAGGSAALASLKSAASQGRAAVASDVEGSRGLSARQMDGLVVAADFPIEAVRSAKTDKANRMTLMKSARRYFPGGFTDLREMDPGEVAVKGMIAPVAAPLHMGVVGIMNGVQDGSEIGGPAVGILGAPVGLVVGVAAGLLTGLVSLLSLPFRVLGTLR
jgi:hypothetical protein